MNLTAMVGFLSGPQNSHELKDDALKSDWIMVALYSSVDSSTNEFRS